MWCHGTVAELLGEAGLCRCAPDARTPAAAVDATSNLPTGQSLEAFPMTRKFRRGQQLMFSLAASSAPASDCCPT